MTHVPEPRARISETVMADSPHLLDATLEAKVLNLLDEGRIVCLATLRPDGWPQVTTVGYVHAGLSLHFAIDEKSQKYDNIRHDPRVSMALAFAPTGSRPARGLYMAARAERVIAGEEVERILEALARSYFGRASFAPKGPSALIIRATPTIVSLAEESVGGGGARTFRVSNPRRALAPTDDPRAR